MTNSFGGTIREMRNAQGIGLRVAAERLGISPTYLSRIERGKERPPRPDTIKRIAGLLGGDADYLFRLAQSTDPSLTEYIRVIPNLPEFLRVAIARELTPDDFEVLIEEIRHRRPSESTPQLSSESTNLEM